MSKFKGTDEQLNNALREAASRGGTVGAICGAAADRLGDLSNEARFLVARLREHESNSQCDEDMREWNGHVEPSLARLEALLSDFRDG